MVLPVHHSAARAPLLAQQASPPAAEPTPGHAAAAAAPVQRGDATDADRAAGAGTRPAHQSRRTCGLQLALPTAAQADAGPVVAQQRADHSQGPTCLRLGGQLHQQQPARHMPCLPIHIV